MATGPAPGQGLKNRGKPPALSVQNTSKSPVKTGLSDICGSWHVNSDESQDSEPGRVHRPPRLNPSPNHRGSPGGGYVVGAAVPLGLPPDMRGAGHGGERRITGPRPLQVRRTCAGGTAKKGAAIRSPGRCSLRATASQPPRVRWGGPLR